jgi:uncharacterized protein
VEIDEPAGVFHEGETAVQRRVGVFESAARLGPRMVQRRLDAEFAGFLAAQPFVVVASSVAPGQVWASMLAGPPGFARATSPQHVVVRAQIDETDPLSRALQDGAAAVGLLVIEPGTRSRIRINGVGQRTPRGLEVELTEVFGNCPKYIQRRVPKAIRERPEPAGGRTAARLDGEQRAFVEAADTFFIASRHPGRGADASHRGGRPGFVAVSAQGRSLTFPDYKGNNMFQTLGNLTVEPAVGLLFIDWDTGRTLQLSGHAEVVWADERVERWPGAQRLVEVAIDAVIDREFGSPLRWEFVEAHRLNPPVPTHDPQRPA